MDAEHQLAQPGLYFPWNLNKAGRPSQLQEQIEEHLFSGLHSVEWKLHSRIQEGPFLGGKDSQDDCGRPWLCW